MMGWAKNAKKHWPSCRIEETESHFDVKDSSGECIVSARRNGAGSWHCAQKDTHARYPLSVVQAPDNLKIEEAKEKASKSSSEA